MLATNRLTCLIALARLLAAGSVSAQSIPLTPVDENVADVSPLRTSLIHLEPDHGWATGFERVYQSPLYPDKFIRIDGAVWAMFPKSEYFETEDGALPVIPASAEFFIGPPPASLLQPPDSGAGGASPNYVSLLAPSRYLGADVPGVSGPAPSRTVSSRSVARQEPATPTYMTVWSSSEYRSRRIGAILHQAREAVLDGSFGR